MSCLPVLLGFYKTGEMHVWSFLHLLHHLVFILVIYFVVSCARCCDASCVASATYLSVVLLWKWVSLHFSCVAQLLCKICCPLACLPCGRAGAKSWSCSTPFCCCARPDLPSHLRFIASRCPPLPPRPETPRIRLLRCPRWIPQCD